MGISLALYNMLHDRVTTLTFMIGFGIFVFMEKERKNIKVEEMNNLHSTV